MNSAHFSPQSGISSQSDFTHRRWFYPIHQTDFIEKSTFVKTKVLFSGAPWRTRTVDTKRRRLVLYPSGLMVHMWFRALLNDSYYNTFLPRLQALFDIFSGSFSKKEALLGGISISVWKRQNSPRSFCWVCVDRNIKLCYNEFYELCHAVRKTWCSIYV